MSVVLSIIVPVYNAQSYLRECIESIINQSFDNIEIILIDNLSTDKSGRICDEYASRDRRIRVVHRKSHGWISDGRNDGLKIATGKWITFVDADDWIEENCYYEIIQEYGETNVDIICEGGYLHSFPNKDVIRENGLGKFEALRKKDILEIQKRILSPGYNTVKPLGLGPVWNIFYNRQFIMDNDLFFAEDVLFSDDSFFNFMVFCKAHSIVGSEYIGYHYRQVNSSISNKYRPDWKDKITHYLRRLHEVILDNSLEDEMKEAYYERVIICLLFIIKGYCFHRDNPMRYKYQKEEVKKLKNIDIYKRAIEFKGKTWLSKKHRIIKYVLKTPFIMPLKLYVLFHDILYKGES